MIRPAPVLMIQGTGSGVGKSFLTAAFCRLARRRGIAVAPFKAQNMSNNAAVTAAGGEMGRAQALQAFAAGLEPEVAMNPVLLKPLRDTRSEVVRMGRPDPRATATSWRERRPLLWPSVRAALDNLRARFHLVIAEGAGSSAETNLRECDVVNMSVARYAGAAVLLVADIDRGGAFASLFGTWSLVDGGDRKLLRGFLLNGFRGDPALLAPAPDDLERRTGVPILGVVPRIQHLLPEEDGGPRLDTPAEAHGGDRLVVGVVRLPRAANLDDLDPLRREAGLALRWVERPRDLAGLAALLLPGSRNTVDDLRWMRTRGLADAVRGWGLDGLPVVGLCAGYQMMGRSVRDPEGVEGGGEEAGLGLLDVETTLGREKETRRTVAKAVPPPAARTASVPPFLRAVGGTSLLGYEIHHGRTRAGPLAVPWLADGRRVLGHAWGPAWGCYLHGVFENDGLREAWLGELGAEGEPAPWGGQLDRELDRVADAVEASVDVDRCLGLALGNAPCG